MHSVWRTSFNFSCATGLLSPCLSPSWSPARFCLDRDLSLVPASHLSMGTRWGPRDKSWWASVDSLYVESPAISNWRISPCFFLTNSLEYYLISSCPSVGRPPLPLTLFQRWDTCALPLGGPVTFWSSVYLVALHLRGSREVEILCIFWLWSLKKGSFILWFSASSTSSVEVDLPFPPLRQTQVLTDSGFEMAQSVLELHFTCVLEWSLYCWEHLFLS